MAKPNGYAALAHSLLSAGPGIHLVVLMHEEWCKAPVMACTCAPDVRVTRDATNDEIIDAAENESDMCAGIRSKLS